MSKSKYNLKYVDEWDLDKDSKKVVKKELRRWIKVFIKRADGMVGSVEKCDFKNDELFFFTDCRDKLADMPEDRAIETDFSIRKRKKQVYMSLFLKQLVGDKIFIPKRPCSHCGFEQMDIGHAFNGYYRFCPKCRRIVMDTFISTIEDCVKVAGEILYKKYVEDGSNGKV